MNDEIHIANVISGTTTPQFVVGIFGKWGSGKTTLMRMIEKELLDKASNTILTVRFDA
jgi:ABC-type lipoprotein export system ATPase subunit